MQHSSAARAALLCAALLAGFGPAYAEFRVFTDAAAFGAATRLQGWDNYLAVPQGIAASNPMSRRTLYGSEYLYQIQAPSSSLVGVGTADETWLSTDVAADTMTFSSFSPSISAFGGSFFGSDFNGQYLAGAVTLVATDASGATFRQTLSNPQVSDFLGLVSSESPIVSISLYTEPMESGDSIWPTARQVVLGESAVSAVPEPSSASMLVLGALSLGLRHLRGRFGRVRRLR